MEEKQLNKLKILFPFNFCNVIFIIESTSITVVRIVAKFMLHTTLKKKISFFGVIDMTENRKPTSREYRHIRLINNFIVIVI